MKIKLKVLISISVISLLSGCGFHFRTAASVPPPMRVMHFEPRNPYSELAMELHNQLVGLNIQLVPEDQAPFTLKILNDSFINSVPSITTTTTAVTITFEQRVTVVILNRKHVPIVGPKTFIVANNLTLNPSQIYTTQTDDLSKQQMREQIATLIYYWLISHHTVEAVTKR